jgi:hypothetical protein
MLLAYHLIQMSGGGVPCNACAQNYDSCHFFPLIMSKLGMLQKIR